jgi:hypothetical protein
LSTTFIASSGGAPGDVAPVAVPAAATLLQPVNMAGAGPQARQNSSEHVSPAPQSAPDVQHFSAAPPHGPGTPPPVPEPVVVVPLELVELQLASKRPRAHALTILVETMAVRSSAQPSWLLGDT